MPHRMLCVDPDGDALAETIELLRTELSDSTGNSALDTRFESARTLEAATEALTRDTAAVITEYELPDGTGLELIARAKENLPRRQLCPLYRDGPGHDRYDRVTG